MIFILILSALLIGSILTVLSSTWSKIYASPTAEDVRYIRRTPDGGYILLANNIHYRSGGAEDAWVIKLNSQGEIEWEKVFGTPMDDELLAVEPLTDGYILAGYTKIDTNNWDAWILRLDKNGNIMWQKAFGFDDTYTYMDKAITIKAVGNEGYIIVGTTDAFDWNFREDIFVLKLNTSGNFELFFNLIR